jgi:3-hydroxyacyl-CoA dehydrogenase/enoyl-CoA hydratase/3-hydroxybutyryl-CoA epimerase
MASAKKSIFIAGADLHSLSQGVDAEGLRSLINLGQGVFNRLAALRIPTVAAIHGACVGGGYELCLACDYRVASQDRATKIGLPETQLGILPGWGGTTRLPRLIGLPKALDIILNGKTVASKLGLKRGMVDELVPKEYLLEIACRRAGKPARRRPGKWLQNNALVAAAILKHLRPRLLKKTRGHYPAVVKALEVATSGISRSIEESLALEREAIVLLGQTEACRNLIRVFFLQERAKKLAVPGVAGKPQPVQRMAVVGAGIMGAGIAQWGSAREIAVTLRDINAEQVGKGMASIAKLYGQGVKRHVFSKVEARAGMDRISPAASEGPLKNMDLVIEAAVEKMPLKKQIFSRLDELAGEKTILATNTSALSISEIAEATRHPERVVGIHFFNPVHRMQLVEVVVGRQTAPEVVQRSVRFVQQIGKLPVVVKDSPGFVVNRILMPYLIEAGILFESGARVENVDEAMLEFGMPMGPLRLIDEVGVDVANHVAETIAKHFSPRLSAPAILPRMLQAGLLGRKSGKGFYLYGANGKEPTVNLEIDQFHRETACANLRRDELRARMVLLMVNEAARCLEEGIVDEAADVDFAMIMGTGFAPFRGGPLQFADTTGIGQVVEEMNALAAKGEARFAPCALLQSMAEKGRQFYTEKGTNI